MEPDARGGLLSHTCPDVDSGLQLAVSAPGGLACSGMSGGGISSCMLLVWHVGQAAVRVDMPAAIRRLAWAPCATLLVCHLGSLLVFVGAQGGVVARQEVPWPFPLEPLLLSPLIGLVWGRLGLLLVFRAEQGVGHELHWYSVSTQPRVQLQHTLRLPTGLRIDSALVLSPDQGHIAFCAWVDDDRGRSSRLIVVPASPARAKTLGSSLSPALGPSCRTDSTHAAKPVLQWLPDGSGVFNTAGGDAAACPSLVRFLHL